MYFLKNPTQEDLEFLRPLCRYMLEKDFVKGKNYNWKTSQWEDYVELKIFPDSKNEILIRMRYGDEKDRFRKG